MEKTIYKISRYVFMAIVSIFGIGFVFWEAMSLTPASKRPQISFVFNNPKTANTIVVSAAAAENTKQSIVSDEVKKADARPQIIKNYLTKYNSPLADYSDEIFDLSQQYGFDYYWIVAIAQQESNLCKKIPEGSHNCWGYGINSAGTLRFESYDLALKSYAEYLDREYFKKGLNNPELIMRKYCPSSNGSWAYGVQHFIDEMESGKF
ncbi:MAG TPA: hypothetical protein VF828_01965 [Patescibacteria group bacterium]